MNIIELNEFMYNHGFCNTDNDEDLPKKYVADLVEAALKEGYNKAIDEFAEVSKKDVMARTFGLRICDIDRIAEQMRGNSEQPKTNADRIRSMSDEELSDYIFGVSIGSEHCVLCSDECDFCELSDEDCKKKTLDWLQSEAE